MTDAVDELIEDRDDAAEAALAKEPKSSKVWLDLIGDAERIFRNYQDKADSIDKLYASLERLSKDNRDREFQLFWANIEVLKPSVYSRPPVPVVVPQFKDRKSVPRMAAELLERSSIVTYRTESIHDVLMAVRDDLVIQARGAVWLRYEAEQKKGYLCQKVCVDRVARKDFLHDPARIWKEVDWVATASHLPRSKMRKRFRETSGDAYKNAAYEVRKDDETDDGKKKARVWELWSKSLDKVVWVTEGVEVVLDEDKPHLELEGFFPCPKPAYGTTQRESLIPVPDMVFYKDQLEEINELTARISALATAVKVRGFYPAGAGDIGDAIEAAVKATTDNQLLIPIANWALVGNAGVKDMIVWLPIDQIVNAIKELVALRKELMDDVYQITGLSDIMRGQTEASETLGAQKLKSQYGSVRIRDRQGEMVRIARDITRIAGEIMAENFSAQSLLDMSQLDVETEASIATKAKPIEAQIRAILAKVEQAKADPQAQAMAQQNPQAAHQAIAQAKGQVDQLKAQLDKLKQVPTIERIMALLRDQRMRPFALDIETDSTIQPDEDAEKQRATEFTTAIGGYMKETLPLVQSMPQAAPLAAQFLKYIASRFRAGRELEGVIDEFADQMAQLASQPKPPDPEQQKAAADAEAKQLKAKTDAETAQADNAERQANAQKTAAEAQAKSLEAQTKAADAESARRISEQQEVDAAEARRIEREGKIAVTNKQIELMEADGVRKTQIDDQTLKKGALELQLLDKKIEQSQVATENSIVATEAAARAKQQAAQPKEPA
ncbi:hypothetical protein [Bradyrhizobium roseum]|uniref:hypothetical protein n=1 Tax=Bradyrhizobium roseum TaxID=3056648 RepID=UPI00260AD8DF|nr:hypothetical protein [Bradyrhizobium roseus]WKA31597.1 hypothetical protein QUH67_16180 [Bradyrhizobium roseus]